MPFPADSRVPGTPDPNVWVVIPLFNEESMVADVVTSLLPHFSNIVCVDDGSSDASALVAERAGAVVVRHPVNLGQGAALQTGIEFALFDEACQYIVTFDADGQHRVEDAVDMLTESRQYDVGVVFGSRFLDGRTKPGWAKKAVLKTAVWVTNMSTGLRLSDAHNGLRVLRRDVAEQIHLRQDRMAHATEIVLQIGRTGARWREHPVELLYTDYSKAKGQSLLNSVNILVDLIIK
ncbi:glycosyltransferase family 2 protein [Microbacterium aurantiacum]|uniref:glycosyltransferase family 2 protein n=1 Tax=Microbacterium aurantiacum TaxID=162393 RepID=UPI004035BADD